jgi:plastocyanin
LTLRHTGGWPDGRAEDTCEEELFALAAIGLATGIMLYGSQGTPAQTQDASSSRSPKVIEVSAKKYEFDPAEVLVKKGIRVELKVHSADETHGITLSLTPEGGNEKASPGLLFDKPEDNGKVEKIMIRFSILWHNRRARMTSSVPRCVESTTAR